MPPGHNAASLPSQMPDGDQPLIMDFGHANLDKSGLIMTKSRDMNSTQLLPDASRRGIASTAVPVRAVIR
jgi:hypothetical protein